MAVPFTPSSLWAAPSPYFSFPLAPAPQAQVRLGVPLRLPADEGAHPAYPIEWWYVTGWLHDRAGAPFGFQITFFRVRPAKVWANPSPFNPSQLLFAQAAVSDPRVGRVLEAGQAARQGFGLAEAKEGRTDVWVGDWFLRQEGGGLDARAVNRHFAYRLRFTPTQPPMPEGDHGFSQKGPDPANASYYYSIPQLAVRGTLEVGGRRHAVEGTAWLDHEWSRAYMPEGAVGWDWMGINLRDGGALMLFRMRRADGQTLWASGTWRGPHGHVRTLPMGQIRMRPLTWWRSPATGIRYPIAWSVATPAARFDLEPLMDDQEVDAKGSTGTIYWEGAVRAVSGGKVLGEGYLELTGYGQQALFLPQESASGPKDAAPPAAR